MGNLILQNDLESDFTFKTIQKIKKMNIILNKLFYIII